MALRQAPYYWLECDGCGARAEYNGGEIAAWQESGQAVDAAEEMDWTTDGEKHHCPSCPSLTRCAECGGPAGDLAGERDLHCAGCWAELEMRNPPVGAA